MEEAQVLCGKVLLSRPAAKGLETGQTGTSEASPVSEPGVLLGKRERDRDTFRRQSDQREVAWAGPSCESGEALGRKWVKSGSGEAVAVGKVQRTGFRADDNSCGCWDVRGHLGLRSPAVLLWEGQGTVGVRCHRGPARWRRVPLSVCLSWASRPSATRVGSGAGHLRRGGAGEGGAAAVSAPPPAVCLPLLARCDRGKLGDTGSSCGTWRIRANGEGRENPGIPSSA